MSRRWLAVVLGLVLAAGGCTAEIGDPATVPSSTPRAVTTMPATTSPSTTTTVAPSIATTTVAVDQRRPVVLDYSPTVSDVGALVFLASHPDLRLEAVTLPGTGESYCTEGVAHTTGVLVLLGLADVPVACGPDDPLTGWNAFPTSWRVASNEMGLPEADPNEERSAPELLADLIRESVVPPEIVAVGPLTNLGVLFSDHPELAGRVAGITIMGGAVDVPGNVFRNEVGEWNIWVDPTAAGVVIGSGADVTLVPLDATNDLPTSRIFYDALDVEAGTPGSVLLRDIWSERPDWIDNPEGWVFFWDELAAATLVAPDVASYETRTLVVDDDTRETKGWTREDLAGTAVRVAVSADRRGFETVFLSTVVGHEAAPAYVTATEGEAAYFAAFSTIDATFNERIDGILAEVGEALGVGEAPGEDDFAALLASALPRVFDEAFLALANDLTELRPPPALAELHNRYGDAVRELYERRADLVEIAAGEAGIDGLIDEIAPATDACMSIEAEATVRLLDVAITCLGG